MKWTNPGHEYDKFCFEWSKDKKYYLWGAGNSGQNFLSKYKDIFDIKAFTDSNTAKYGTRFSGISVLAPQQFVPLLPGHKVIVTSTAYWQIKPILLQYGLKENIDFCDFHLFNSVYNLYPFGEEGIKQYIKSEIILFGGENGFFVKS